MPPTYPSYTFEYPEGQVVVPQRVNVVPWQTAHVKLTAPLAYCPRRPAPPETALQSIPPSQLTQPPAGAPESRQNVLLAPPPSDWMDAIWPVYNCVFPPPHVVTPHTV